MRGPKIFRRPTQTLASARMSAWTKRGGNKSHSSVGRYIWIQFQHEEVLLQVTCAHWTQRTSALWFLVACFIIRQGLTWGVSRVRTDTGCLGHLIASLPTFCGWSRNTLRRLCSSYCVVRVRIWTSLHLVCGCIAYYLQYMLEYKDRHACFIRRTDG